MSRRRNSNYLGKHTSVNALGLKIKNKSNSLNYLIILILIVALGVGGYFIYEKKFSKKNDDM